MFFTHILPLGYLLVAAVSAQSIVLTGAQASSTTGSSSGSVTDSATYTEPTVPTGSYRTYLSTITVSNANGVFGSISITTAMETYNGTMTQSIVPTTPSVTFLTGTNGASTSMLNGTASSNATASSTSTAAQPTNTTPCNNYVEFCSRQYSNITMVAAHNSPFVLAGNAAANQALAVTTQLDDGIRLLQAQAHTVNGTIYLCHGSCEILNAGTLTAYLTTVNAWVKAHPYDVVTILIGNGDYNTVTDFVAPIQASGIDLYAYQPPKIPMEVKDWPTLASMILTGRRVVIFMDYEADQSKVPWILDEFTQVWETPFDPTNRSFPCTLQRPPGINDAEVKARLYIANHNLNTQLTLLGNSILVPSTPLLNITNNVTGYGSLGETATQCAQSWGRPPNFLNVDYYNIGNGSVFEVAAKWNNVTYTRSCCGLVASGADGRLRNIVGRAWWTLAMVIVLASWLSL